MTRTAGGSATPLEDRVRDAIRVKAARSLRTRYRRSGCRTAAGPPSLFLTVAGERRRTGGAGAGRGRLGRAALGRAHRRRGRGGGRLAMVSGQGDRLKLLVRVLNVVRDMASDVEQIHWISPSGRVLILTDALRARHHSNAHVADVDAGMLVDSHYTPLPWSENTFTAAW